MTPAQYAYQVFDSVGELQCECNAFSKARDIATALNAADKATFEIHHNGEIVWTTRDGWTY
jgi:hypothetical protein